MAWDLQPLHKESPRRFILGAIKQCQCMVSLKDFPIMVWCLGYLNIQWPMLTRTKIWLVLQWLYWDGKTLMKISLPAAQERFGLVKGLGGLTKRTGFALKLAHGCYDMVLGEVSWNTSRTPRWYAILLAIMKYTNFRYQFKSCMILRHLEL